MTEKSMGAVFLLILSQAALAADFDPCATAVSLHGEGDILARCQEVADGNVSGRAALAVDSVDLCILQTDREWVLTGLQAASYTRQPNAGHSGLVHEAFASRPGTGASVFTRKTDEEQLEIAVSADHATVRVQRTLIERDLFASKKKLWEDAIYRCR